MSEPYVMWFEDCDRSAIDRVGGKCAGLGELLKAGVRVPVGFALTTRALSDFLDATGLAPEIERQLSGLDADDVAAVAAASREVSRLVTDAAMPDSLHEPIAAGYQQLSERCGTEDLPVAVRSSAVAEDLDGASFAGQLETFLWLRGTDEVVRHVLRCWAGFFSPEALTYRARVGLDNAHVAMSVAVQQMVQASSSGVMFTLNPRNGDRSKIAIDGAWGLGEAVVSGEVTPDHFLVDKVTLDVIHRVISSKDYELAFNPASGTIAGREVKGPRSTEPSLSDAELTELSGLAKRVERHHGRPQDIEWAIERRGGDSVIHLLQSRGETVWSTKQTGPAVPQAGGSALDRVLSDMVGRVGTGRVLSSSDPKRRGS